MSPLHLSLTDYQDETRWRWQLNDERGNFIADHEVRLDPKDKEYRGFVDLPYYLAQYVVAGPGDDAQSVRTQQDQLLNEVGAWIGDKVFGGLINALRDRLQSPATVIRASIPPEAQALLSRPFELAQIGGQTFVEQGIRFVYQAPTPTPYPPPSRKDATGEGGLRVLAIFSLPDDQHPLNLRRERYQLVRLLETIAQTHGVAIETRVIQYGATRKTLEDALQEAPGWDVLHFSGHGLEGQLALEKENGPLDVITTDELKPMLRLAKSRVRLITLSACLSGAATVQAAKAQLGMAASPAEQNVPELTVLPGLAQDVAHDLDSAAVAMRYSVETDFAERLLLAMYGLMLEKHQPLASALHLALIDALKAAAPALSPITPIVFGARAADLTLAAPGRPPDFKVPATGLLNFPDEPERFVGRLMPMLRATHALAPQSAQRGVLFYGMAGAGKTTCAVELAYRHEQGRFTGCVWHKAPNEGDDIGRALLNFLIDCEAQLTIPDHALVSNVDDPVVFEKRTLPRLKQMLKDTAALIVVDNLEGLLTESDNWRDPKWGKLIDTLLAHTGPSRVVITSRRMPLSLANNPKLLREAIHALSFSESVLLAHELPNLQSLFSTAEGRELLTRVLLIAQGHPKLLELADKMASDLDALQARIDQAEQDADATHAPLAAFFHTGESKQGAENFSATLRGWTMGVVAKLTPTARLLFHFLCRIEDADRQSDIVEANWEDFLNRLAQEGEGREPRCRFRHGDAGTASHRRARADRT